MKEDTLSCRVLVLKFNNIDILEIPVFESGFESYISIRNNSTNAMYNNYIRKEILKDIKEKTKYLSLSTKIKSWWYLRKIKDYDTICFVQDHDGMVAFTPECRILNLLLDYSTKFNCMEVLYDAIYIIGKQMIQYPNLKISSDVKAYIDYRKPTDKLSFSWRGNWNIDLKER